MRSFTKYVSQLFVEYLILVWLGFTALLQIFDLLANSEEISRRFPNTFSPILTYAIWRIPEICSFILPFVVLLALLLTLSRLERNHEIMAFKAAGAPYSYVLLALVPSVTIVTIFHFILIDRAVPSSIAYLDQQGLRVEKSSGKGDIEPLWRRDENVIIRVADVQKDGNLLINATLYKRDENGALYEKINTDRANYDVSNRIWMLENVHILALQVGQQGLQSRVKQMEWRSNLAPSDFADLSERPEGLRLSQIATYAFGEKTGTRPDYFYSTWFFRRIFLPFSSFLMILLAAPVAHSLQSRNRNLVFGIASGFLLGFLYFIGDGLSLSLGESGVLPPLLAVTIPIFVFGSIGGLALIRAEGY